jgi:ABC-type multidrug transport system fused ATPase/permease subunit
VTVRQRLRLRDCLTRIELSSIVALGIVNSATVLLLILAMRHVLGTIAGNAGQAAAPSSLFGVVGLILVALCHSTLRGLEFSVPETISFRSIHRLRLRIHGHMLGMSARQIQHRSRGSLILRLTGDLTMLRTWFSRGLGPAIISGLSFTACIVAVALISVPIAAAVTGCFGVGFAASLLCGQRLQRLTARVRRKRSLLTSNVDEQVNALAVIQVAGRTRGEQSRLSQQSESLTLSLIQEARTRGVLRGISSASGWMALCAAIAIGAQELSQGRTDLGSIVVAIVVARLLQGYARSLGLAHDYWRRAQVSRRKLEDFFNSSSRNLYDPALDKLEHNRAAIVFDDVSLPGALQSFTATVEAGRHVAIVGPSGAGKTTLLQMVSRMADPTTGRVLIGDQDISQCQIASVHRKIGMVGPDLPLMRGTVRRNLCYRHPNATDQDLATLIRRYRLGPLLNSFAGHLDHWITEGGANLSLGERQRLELCRALFGAPPILLLDDAMTALDEESRRFFREVIGRYAGTIISVTDDPADIGAADVVWSLDGGRLQHEETARQFLDLNKSRRPLALVG